MPPNFCGLCRGRRRCSGGGGGSPTGLGLLEAGGRSSGGSSDSSGARQWPEGSTDVGGQSQRWPPVGRALEAAEAVEQC